jgi:hypothetical protein
MRQSTRGHRLLTRCALGVWTLGFAAGCNKSPTQTTPVLATETLTGTLAPLATSSKNFNVNFAYYASDASVTVTAMTTVASSTPVDTTIGVAFGSIQFDGSCGRSTAYTAAAAHIGQELVASGVFIGPNTYCVQIFDSGTLAEPINYTLTVKHY